MEAQDLPDYLDPDGGVANPPSTEIALLSRPEMEKKEKFRLQFLTLKIFPLRACLPVFVLSYPKIKVLFFLPTYS